MKTKSEKEEAEDETKKICVYADILIEMKPEEFYDPKEPNDEVWEKLDDILWDLPVEKRVVLHVRKATDEEVNQWLEEA